MSLTLTAIECVQRERDSAKPAFTLDVLTKLLYRIQGAALNNFVNSLLRQDRRRSLSSEVSYTRDSSISIRNNTSAYLYLCYVVHGHSADRKFKSSSINWRYVDGTSSANDGFRSKCIVSTNRFVFWRIYRKLLKTPGNETHFAAIYAVSLKLEIRRLKSPT